MLNILIALVVIKNLWSIVLSLANLVYSTNRKAKVPEVFSDVIDLEIFEKNKHYTKDKMLMSVLSTAVNLLVLLWLILKGVPEIENIAKSISENIFIQSLLFFGLLGIIQFIMDMPFDVYSTFVLEQKYGFNTTTPKTFLMDILKSLILTVTFGTPIILILMWFLIKFETWWWQASIFGIAVTFFYSYISPILIAPLFNKFKELEDIELKDKIKTLLEKAKVKIPKIYVVDASKRTKKQNAYVTGFGTSRRLVLFDNLLSYPKEEILSVIAHELGHHEKRHIPKLMFVSALYEVFVLFLMNQLYKIFSSTKPGISQPYAVFFYCSLFVVSIVFFLTPLMNYMNRKLEYEADKYSAELIGSSKPLMNALKRLIKENLTSLSPLPLYKTWYYSHPAPEERINKLSKLEK
ncbi:MAG: M48 family metallopeptidase [Fervidobacterium sp.]